MTLKETEEYITNRILVQYNFDEAKSIAKIALQFVLKMNNLNYSLGYQTTIPKEIFYIIDQYLNRLQWGEPIQYITGEAHFLGFDFNVSKEVLIPRRETEELVDLIAHDYRGKSGVTLLDIGTGSGCIAITLSKLLHHAKVYALDVSEDALYIARNNALKMAAEIAFIHADILKLEALHFDTFDVIVSNPPYVTLKEKVHMHKNVLEYEPHTALFVPDNDPLLFYKKIAQLASGSLNNRGKLYFEVNENYASETADILHDTNFSSIEIIKDMQGKNRIVKAEILK